MSAEPLSPPLHDEWALDLHGLSLPQVSTPTHDDWAIDFALRQKTTASHPPIHDDWAVRLSA